MADREQLAQLKRGTQEWNAWRSRHPDIRPDLAGADLTEADLRGANLTGADLTEADLTGADLTGADLQKATLNEANLGAPLPCAPRRGDLPRSVPPRGGSSLGVPQRGEL
jgi:hypothetical protein